MPYAMVLFKYLKSMGTAYKVDILGVSATSKIDDLSPYYNEEELKTTPVEEWKNEPSSVLVLLSTIDLQGSLVCFEWYGLNYKVSLSGLHVLGKKASVSDSSKPCQATYFNSWVCSGHGQRK